MYRNDLLFIHEFQFEYETIKKLIILNDRNNDNRLIEEKNKSIFATDFLSLYIYVGIYLCVPCGI